jgi:hypothetical protein
MAAVLVFIAVIAFTQTQAEVYPNNYMLSNTGSPAVDGSNVIQHKISMHNRHAHKNHKSGDKLKSAVMLLTEEHKKEIIASSPEASVTHNFIPVLSESQPTAETDSVYKETKNLTILKTRK